MMQEAIKERGGDDGVAEDVPPLSEAAVGGEDHRALFVAGVDELEEQIAAAGDDGQIADLVDDEQREAAEVSDPFAQGAFPFGFGERGDDIGERAEVDAATGLHRLDAERETEVGLSGPRRADKVDGLSPVDELQSGKSYDAVFVERGLEGEVEAGKCLDSRQLGHL